MDDPSFSSSSAGSSQSDPNRRPIKMRSTRWARALAAAFAKFGVRPNQVSLFSVACALIGAGLFLTEASGPGSSWILIGAPVCIQLPLLANMLAGLLAVAAHQQTTLAGLSNSSPVRLVITSLL